MMCTSIAKVDLFLSHNTFFIICVNHKHQLYCNLFQLTFFLLLFLRQGKPCRVDPYLHSCFNEMLTNGVKMLPYDFNFGYIRFQNKFYLVILNHYEYGTMRYNWSRGDG